MSTFLLLTFKYGKYDIIHASMPFILCFFLGEDTFGNMYHQFMY